MAFVDFLDSLKPLADLARILAGFGLITVLLAVLKRNGDRSRWRKFKVRVHQWMDGVQEAENRHPREFVDDEWTAKCERMLSDSKFSPLEIDQIMETAVVVAKGIAADRLLL